MSPKFESLTEVRDEIDRVDRQIVALIAERGGLVGQAGMFKETPEAVFDNTRFE